MLALAGTLTKVATLRSRPGRALRNSILRLLDHVAPFKRRLAMNLSGLSRATSRSCLPVAPVPGNG